MTARLLDPRYNRRPSQGQPRLHPAEPRRAFPLRFGEPLSYLLGSNARPSG